MEACQGDAGSLPPHVLMRALSLKYRQNRLIVKIYFEDTLLITVHEFHRHVCFFLEIRLGMLFIRLYEFQLRYRACFLNYSRYPYVPSTVMATARFCHAKGILRAC